MERDKKSKKNKIHIVLMVAANGKYPEESRLTELFQGRPLYEYSLMTALDVARKRGNMDITAITQSPEIYDYLTSGEFLMVASGVSYHAVFNPDSMLGVSYSVRAGLRSIFQNYGYSSGEDYFLFWDCDRPEFQADDMLDFVDETIKSALPMGYATTKSGLSSPFMFRRDVEGRLFALSGNENVGKVIKDRPEQAFKYMLA